MREREIRSGKREGRKGVERKGEGREGERERQRRGQREIGGKRREGKGKGEEGDRGGREEGEREKEGREGSDCAGCLLCSPTLNPFQYPAQDGPWQL